MNFNNFTIKSQEAVQQAVNLVQSQGQQAIEPEHLLAGLLKVGENVTNFIFQKLGMNGRQIATVVEKQIASLPKVSGGEPYLSRDANEVLQKAVEVSKSLNDEYVSLEALLLALLQVKSTASHFHIDKSDFTFCLVVSPTSLTEFLILKYNRSPDSENCKAPSANFPKPSGKRAEPGIIESQGLNFGSSKITTDFIVSFFEMVRFKTASLSNLGLKQAAVKSKLPSYTGSNRLSCLLFKSYTETNKLESFF